MDLGPVEPGSEYWVQCQSIWSGMEYWLGMGYWVQYWPGSEYWVGVLIENNYWSYQNSILFYISHFIFDHSSRNISHRSLGDQELNTVQS